MSQSQQALDQQLKDFRKKYYLDKIVRGSLILALLISSMLFIALLSEGLFGFSAVVRTGMVGILGLTFLGVLGYMIVYPALQWSRVTRGINEYDIAGMVQRFFPGINDKLLNLLQLREEAQEQGALAYAAVESKAQDILPSRISSAINLRVNWKYLWYLLIPIGLYCITYLSDPQILGAGANRLKNYNQEFLPPPPFQINLSEIPDQLVAGEALDLNVSVDGNELPGELFVFVKNDAETDAGFVDYSMDKLDATHFEYKLSDLKHDISLYIGNPEVSTQVHEIKVLRRPFIKQFQATIQYPAYTGLSPEVMDANVGDFKVLRGSYVSWKLIPQGDVDKVSMVSDASESFNFESDEEGQEYKYSRRIMSDLSYTLLLESGDQISNADTVRYQVSTSPDRYPSIYVFSPGQDFLVDIDPNMPLQLEIADDFGFSQLELHYRFIKSGGISEVSEDFQVYPLSFEKRTLLQPLNYNVDLTGLGLMEGDELEYYIKVWDNDGVSGPKSSTSATYKVVYPTLDARYDEIAADQQAVEDQLERLRQTSDELRDAYDRMQKKLLEQQELSFDDKKELQRMLQEHRNMMEQVEQTQQQFEETKEQLQENQMVSEQTMERYEQLNELMEEMNDPELQELMKELQERMDQLNPEDFKEQLDQLQMNDEQLRESLERTLELLKQLEVQQKIDEVRNKLQNLEAKQRVLQERTENAESAEDLQQVSQQQESLNDQMDDLQEDMDDLSEMKEGTNTPDEEQMDQLEEMSDEAQQEMENAQQQTHEASEQRQEGGRKNRQESQESQQGASESQQKAADQMQQMGEQLSSMQMSMQMQQDEQNLESLRELLENLLTLSFDQEDLRNEVQNIRYGDPSLQDRSQDQKNLQDDMTLVSDSLDALAKRMFMIQDFVMEESDKITRNMDQSQEFFRNKQIQRVTYHQQEAMTSINNLANMLSDIMKQVQEQMKNAQAGQGMCQKPGEQGQSMQKISQQQQQLNQQMQQMMQQPGQNQGDQLQQMAAQQEAIRKQLEEAQQRMNGENGGSMGDMDKVMQDMQESEQDLINKQLTSEMMERQQRILSRLLQAQQSVREQDWDDKRESQTGRNAEQKSPEELSLEEYRDRIRQELLKSNKLEYSTDFMILIEEYYKKLEQANE